MARKKQTPESGLVGQCLRYLELLGVPAWRNNVGAMRCGERYIRFGPVGASDILGCLPPAGRLLALECKVAPNKPTTAQREFLRRVRRAGGVGAVVYRLEDLEEALWGDGGEADGAPIVDRAGRERQSP